jgi:long-chain acyl-CoA synthetase
MLDLAERPVAASRPWLAQYDPGVPATLDYPAVRLDELLHRAADRDPRRSALVFFGSRTSYKTLDEAVGRVAGGLRRMGLAPGERVALFMPNCPQLVIGCYAVWRAGCVVVPVNPRATGSELTRQLSDSGAAGAIVLDRLWLDVEGAALPPTVRHLIVAALADDLPLIPRIGARVAMRGRSDGRSVPGSREAVPFRSLVDRGDEQPVPAPVGADEPAVLLYTGGTTGLPKAAVLTHRNMVANACQLGAWAVTLDDGAEVMLSALPLAHGYAMTTCMNVSVLRRWTQVLVPDARDLDRLLREIERWRVTALPGVPTLYASLASHPSVRSGGRNLRSIEACLSGAAAIPVGIQAEFEQLTGGRLVEGYGLTEASPATHCNPLGSGGRSGSIGLPLPDTDCRLVDIETETKVVEPGQSGVLCVSGPQVMAGYWRRPADTAQVLRQGNDGRVWLHTGDIAEMSADGYFHIVDRKKDIIVASGGLKVYPNEIEDVLSMYPKVRLSAVIGVPRGGTDQRAKAFVVLREGQRADGDEILAFLRSRLAPYKVPKTIEFRTELPLAFTGKVLRRVLAEEQRVLEAGRVCEPDQLLRLDARDSGPEHRRLSRPPALHRRLAGQRRGDERGAGGRPAPLRDVRPRAPLRAWRASLQPDHLVHRRNTWRQHVRLLPGVSRHVAARDRRLGARRGFLTEAFPGRRPPLVSGLALLIRAASAAGRPLNRPLIASRAGRRKNVNASQQGEDQVLPYPKGRRFLEAAMRSTRHKPMIHGLLEVDVTRARARLREHQARTGETLSFRIRQLAPELRRLPTVDAHPPGDGQSQDCRHVRRSSARDALWRGKRHGSVHRPRLQRRRGRGRRAWPHQGDARCARCSPDTSTGGHA